MPKTARVTSTIGTILVTSHNDGVDHINIYSHARTELGRKLSNFNKNPFVHPQYGSFLSMEGYWYWLATGKKHNLLREKYGFEAKSYGRTKPRVKDPNFEANVIEGLHCMFRDNPDLLSKLMATTLPLTHYYNYTNTLLDNPTALFLLSEFDMLRNGKPLMFS